LRAAVASGKGASCGAGSRKEKAFFRRVFVIEGGLICFIEAPCTACHRKARFIIFTEISIYAS